MSMVLILPLKLPERVVHNELLIASIESIIRSYINYSTRTEYTSLREWWIKYKTKGTILPVGSPILDTIHLEVDECVEAVNESLNFFKNAFKAIQPDSYVKVNVLSVNLTDNIVSVRISSEDVYSERNEDISQSSR